MINVHLNRQVEPLEEETARQYLRQIALGIEYLHHNEIVHRDIKPDNILLTKDRRECKIVDFGVSEMFVKPGDDRLRKSAGSPAFMSPELCTAGHGDYHGKPDDMWSLGVTLYCMVTGRLPFDKSQFLELYRAIREDEPDYAGAGAVDGDDAEDKDKGEGKSTRQLSPELIACLRGLLCKDPEKRMTTDGLREDAWVTRHGTEPMLAKSENLTDLVEEITEDEVRRAIVKTGGLFALVRAAARFKHRANSRRTSRTSSMGSTISDAGSSAGSGVGADDSAGAGGGGGGHGGEAMAATFSARSVAESIGRMGTPREDAEREEDESRGSAPAAGSRPMQRFFSSTSSSGSSAGASSSAGGSGSGSGGGGGAGPSITGVKGRYTISPASSALAGLRIQDEPAGGLAPIEEASPITPVQSRWKQLPLSALGREVKEKEKERDKGKAAGAKAESDDSAQSERREEEKEDEDKNKSSSLDRLKHVAQNLQEAGLKKAQNAWDELHPAHKDYSKITSPSSSSSSGKEDEQKQRRAETHFPQGSCASAKRLDPDEAVRNGDPDATNLHGQRLSTPSPRGGGSDSQTHSGSPTATPSSSTKRLSKEEKHLELPAPPSFPPRLLDGPLVASPAIGKIKTPDGASEFYKGKPPPAPEDRREEEEH